MIELTCYNVPITRKKHSNSDCEKGKGKKFLNQEDKMLAGTVRSNSMLFQDTQRSWTDDLPVCKQSGNFSSLN